MKKFFGILLCVIGLLGTIFMILAGRNKVLWIPSVGLFVTDKSQVIAMAVVLLLFILILVAGMRLLRKTKVDLLEEKKQEYEEMLYNLERLKTDHSYEQQPYFSCESANGKRHAEPTSWYAKNEGLIHILYRLSGALAILCFIGCIVTYQINNRADYTYQKVIATVESCEQLTDAQIANQKKPKVIVRYNNQTYPLQNVSQGSWYYPKGMEKEVFLAKGRMYADEAGVTSSGPTAKLYFGFLFGLMGFTIGFLILRFMRKEIRMQTM